jgi:hypothetical protein
MDLRRVFQKVSSEYRSKEQLAFEQRIENISETILYINRVEQTKGYLCLPYRLTPDIADHFRKAGFTVKDCNVVGKRYKARSKSNVQDKYIMGTQISWIPQSFTNKIS